MVGVAWQGVRISVLALACLVLTAAHDPVPRAGADTGSAGLSAACPSDGAAGDPHPVIALRGLQVRLMVAALSCGLRDGYDAFVRRFSNQLVANADALRVRFRGRGGTAAVDRLVTRLANAAAQRSTDDRAGFCASARRTLNRLSRTAPADLNRLAVETWDGMTCPAR